MGCAIKAGKVEIIQDLLSARASPYNCATALGSAPDAKKARLSALELAKAEGNNTRLFVDIELAMRREQMTALLANAFTAARRPALNRESPIVRLSHRSSIFDTQVFRVIGRSAGFLPPLKSNSTSAQEVSDTEPVCAPKK